MEMTAGDLAGQNIVVYIRLASREEQKSSNKARSAESIWTAEFELELPGCGDLRVELMIDSLAVSVTITCTKISTANQLEKNQNSLSDSLESDGLQLSSFRCCSTSKAEFYASRSAGKKLLANVENIPLQSFEMRKNDREFNPINGIPEFLYSAMASLFSYVFEIENGLD